MERIVSINDTSNVNLEHMANLINSAKLHERVGNGGINLHIIISNYKRADLSDPDKDLRRTNTIIRHVSEQMGISQFDLLTRKTRQSIFVFTKMLVSYFLRKHTDLTLRKIAETLWHGYGPAPHHSTIIHLCKVCQDMIDSQQTKHDFYRNYLILSDMFEVFFDSGAGSKDS